MSIVYLYLHAEPTVQKHERLTITRGSSAYHQAQSNKSDGSHFSPTFLSLLMVIEAETHALLYAKFDARTPDI